jgi:hypothetical protein
VTRGLHQIADAVAALAVEKLRKAPAGAIECEFPDGWRNSRGGARLLFLNTAAVGSDRMPPVTHFASSLLKLYKPYAPTSPAELEDFAFKDWAKKWRLESAPWAMAWGRMVLRAYDDREQDKCHSGMAHDAPMIARIPAKNRKTKSAKRALALKMRFMPPPVDPETYEWITSVAPYSVRMFTSPAPKPWQPDVVSRKQYRDYIEGYLDTVKALAIKAGMVEHLPPLKHREPRHYDWLVRFQIMGDGLEQISRAAGESVATIWKGIRDLARDIELKPRRQSRR